MAERGCLEARQGKVEGQGFSGRSRDVTAMICDLRKIDR